MKKAFHGVVPCILEPNGEAKDFLKAVKDPETKRHYFELLKEMKCRPSETTSKLREVTWGKKSVDEVLSE
jgi:hypothetical protein